jgi:hypothetical protein
LAGDVQDNRLVVGQGAVDQQQRHIPADAFAVAGRRGAELDIRRQQPALFQRLDEQPSVVSSSQRFSTL